MLWVKFPVVDRIQPKSNKFAKGVEGKAAGDSKQNDSPVVVTDSTWKIYLNKF